MTALRNIAGIVQPNIIAPILVLILASCSHKATQKPAVVATEHQRSISPAAARFSGLLRPSDEAIQAATRNLFALANLPHDRIEVRSEKGQVSVTGTLDDELLKQRLVDAIHALKGVRQVEDRIAVAAPSPSNESEGNWLRGLVEVLAVPLAIALLPLLFIIVYVELRLAHARRTARKKAEAETAPESQHKPEAA